MATPKSKSLKIARQFLGQEVSVVIDRPLGSKHPKYKFIYESNYGYLPGIMAPDGECLDAYFLGVSSALEEASGMVRAIIHRLDDDDDKLVVIPAGSILTQAEIEAAVNFQEKWFKHEIIF